MRKLTKKTTKKTTIELDEVKLAKIMQLTGIKTRRAAIAFALDQAERTAQVMQVLEGDFFVVGKAPIVDKRYDVIALRRAEIP